MRVNRYGIAGRQGAIEQLAERRWIQLIHFGMIVLDRMAIARFVAASSIVS